MPAVLLVLNHTLCDDRLRSFVTEPDSVVHGTLLCKFVGFILQIVVKLWVGLLDV